MIFCIHKWSQWKDVPIKWESPLFKLKSYEIGQEKICLKCNKKKLRTMDN